MLKSKKPHINKNCLKAIHTDTKTRNLVECKCTLHCYGSRWYYSSTSRSIKNNSIVTETVSASKRKKVIKLVEQNHSSYEDTPSDDEPTPIILTDQNLIDVLNKRKYYMIKYNILDNDDLEIVLDLSDYREDYEILINDEEFSIEKDDHTLSSFSNSQQCIEPELLRIITQNLRLDDLISNQSNNSKLTETFKLVKSQLITGSLALYNGFDFAELYRFM
ncbi:15827_t:CDS:2 [Funneliformis mosseae]|uniref:15827_t:CDS:1 n=1 Tax=Funneliformis mosseae TaxID=27381 RepID=A0A9N9BA62_FUNMO|nr:15827_t:CDS:2 [Funneliformis mosseae]